MENGNGAQLWCLFKWLAQLRQLKPLEAVFVFDGPEVPARVDGPFTIPFPLDIIIIFKSMIISMGFLVREVSGEFF